MKTQIIHLEPYDDIYSAKDKMGWGQTSRILLVWPVRGRILNRLVDLIMLKRHSAELGSQLAFVVQDSDIKMHARELGIPVFNSTRKAEKTPWRPERKQRGALPLTVKRQSMNIWRRRRIPMNLERMRALAHPATPKWVAHPFTRVTAFTIGVLAVLAIAALLIPSAEIRLTPETQTESITISVAASPEFQSVDLSGVVPARSITIAVEGRSSIPTTGSIPLPDQFSSGEVNFTNLTERSLAIPEGLVVTTLDEVPIRFKTTRSAVVPPGEEGVIVPIEALIPGESSNTGPREIVAIEGPLGLDLIVFNRRSTRGGSDQDAPAPSEDDYQNLYNQLFATLSDSAMDEMRASLSPDDLMLSEEAKHVATPEETYTPDTILPSDQLQLVLRLEFQAYIVTGEELRSLGQSALEANVIKGFSADPSSIEIRHLNIPSISDQDSGSVNWRMQAEWQIQADLDTTQAVKLAIGQDPELASQRITENLALKSPAEIRLIPSWWPRMPFLPFRITIAENN